VQRTINMKCRKCVLMDAKRLLHPPDQMTVLPNNLSLHLQSQCTADMSNGQCSLILGQSKAKGKQSPTFPTDFTHHKSFFLVLLHQSTHCSPCMSSGQHPDLCTRPTPPRKESGWRQKKFGDACYRLTPRLYTCFIKL